MSPTGAHTSSLPTDAREDHGQQAEDQAEQGPSLPRRKRRRSSSPSPSSSPSSLPSKLIWVLLLSIQILDIDAENEDDGAVVNEDSKRSGKSAVIKTSTRQVSSPIPSSFLPHLLALTLPPSRSSCSLLLVDTCRPSSSLSSVSSHRRS